MFLDESTKCATIKDKDGNMALHSACECDKPSSKVILRLIQANPKALKKRDKEGNLPLHSVSKFDFPKPKNDIPSNTASPICTLRSTGTGAW